jgi:hypothetical protein
LALVVVFVELGVVVWAAALCFACLVAAAVFALPAGVVDDVEVVGTVCAVAVVVRLVETVLERDALAPHAAIPNDERRGIATAAIDQRRNCCKSGPKSRSCHCLVGCGY